MSFGEQVLLVLCPGQRHPWDMKSQLMLHQQWRIVRLYVCYLPRVPVPVGGSHYFLGHFVNLTAWVYAFLLFFFMPDYYKICVPVFLPSSLLVHQSPCLPAYLLLLSAASFTGCHNASSIFISPSHAFSCATTPTNTSVLTASTTTSLDFHFCLPACLSLLMYLALCSPVYLDVVQYAYFPLPTTSRLLPTYVRYSHQQALSPCLNQDRSDLC